MGSISEKLTVLNLTKSGIRDALNVKGADISGEDSFASYVEQIDLLPTGGDPTETGWAPHWYDANDRLIDISSPAANTIKMLIDTRIGTRFFSFHCTTTGGTYNVDWGDGTSDTQTSGQIITHTYADSESNNPYVVLTISADSTLTQYASSHEGIWTSNVLGTLWITVNAPLIDFSVAQTTPTNICLQMLEAVHLQSVVEVSSYAFANCTSLVDVSLPNTLTALGTYCFSGCNSLAAVTIPESITTLPNYCMTNCSNLRSFTLPINATSTGTDCFYGCSKLGEFICPVGSKLDTIGQRCFGNCYNLRNVVLRAPLSQLNRQAFSNCYALESITLPNSLDYVSDNVFEMCTHLSSVTYSGTPTQIWSMANMFLSCPSLAQVDFRNVRAKGFALTGLGTSATGALGTKGNIDGYDSPIWIDWANSPFDGATSYIIDMRYSKLTVSQMVAIFNHLPTVSGTKRITLASGAESIQLTQEQRAIATSKGWTLSV